MDRQNSNFSGRNKYRVIMSLLVVATMSISACATNPNGNSPNIISDLGTLLSNDLSDEQSALRAHEKDYAQSRVAAAATGAVVAGVACALLGCSTEETVAAVAVGGTAGYVGSTYLTRDHAEFQTSQAALNADIAETQKQTQHVERSVKLSKTLLRYQKAEIGRLNTAYKASKLTTSQYRKRLKTFEGDLTSVENQRAETSKRIASMEQSIAAYKRDGYSTSELSKELSKQRAYYESLTDVQESMVDVIASAPNEVRNG
jgi:septal ring factor EnvC (AmiA/AmiB activator)